MIPPPALMIRSALAFLQLGHFLVGTALMDWNSSHLFSQALHRYSYVGITARFSTNMIGQETNGTEDSFRPQNSTFVARRSCQGVLSTFRWRTGDNHACGTNDAVMNSITHFHDLKHCHRLTIGRWNLSQRFMQIGVKCFAQGIDWFRSM